MLDITNEDFQRLHVFVKKEYGIDLSKKKQLIVGRLSATVLSMGLSSFHEYVDRLITMKNPEDIEIMLNRLTTNYTYFMREENHFRFCQQTILPYLEKTKKNRVLSIWSAGCSTGQEPYTISMFLKEYFGSKADLWDTRVLATDISQNVLGIAREGIYDAEALSKLSPAWRDKYFRPAGNGMFSVSPELKSNVIFRTYNLMDPIRFRLKFDVIFCRNVMIYFDPKTKDQLAQRFYDASSPGAYLLIGHSESLDKKNLKYEYIQPAVYRKPL